MKNRVWVMAILAVASTSLLPAAGGSFVGLTGRDLTPDRAAQLKLDGLSGAEIVAVRAPSPAAKAGLKPGDVIIGLNGTPVDGINQVKAGIEHTPPGHWMKFAVVREGNQIMVAVQTADAAAKEPIQAAGLNPPSGDNPPSAMDNCRDGAVKAGTLVAGVAALACVLDLFATGGLACATIATTAAGKAIIAGAVGCAAGAAVGSSTSGGTVGGGIGIHDIPFPE